MTSRPRLTIGLPVYNGADHLVASLDALLGQTYGDFELIISSNASTDGTDDICRDYEARDSRIRLVRQPRNIGAAPNHDAVFREATGELFKWASADDLYARDLLETCVGILGDHPEAVLAHSWTAAVNAEARVIQAHAYPLATASHQAPERFRSMLFDGDDLPGAIRADDFYGVIRSDVLRRVKPHGSFYHADQVFMAELALHGPFVQFPDWLYFRRHHDGRAFNANPTVRSWCANLDPRRENPFRHPAARLVAEYAWGYAAALRRAPLSPGDRRECVRHLLRWGASRAGRRLPVPAGRAARAGGAVPARFEVAGREVGLVERTVAGQGSA